MKKKTFILTLMMLLCTFVFGQSTYPKYEVSFSGEFENSMPIIATISFDGEIQNKELEVGVFCNGEVRASALTRNYLGDGKYYVFTTVPGKSKNLFTFKVYDHSTGIEWSNGCTIENVTDKPIEQISFSEDGYGTFDNPFSINFTTPEKPNHWTPNDGNFDNNFVLIGVVSIDGVEQTNPNLELGAFCGNECRGSVKTTLTYTFNGITRNYAWMTINGRTGENITFKLFDHEINEEFSFLEVNSITISEDTYGSVYNPFVVNFITSSYVAQIGETKYQSFDAALAAAQDGDEIILLADIDLAETAVVSKDINIALGSYKVNGTIELANVGATVTGAQDAVTSVITNIADYKVVYADDMYKVVAKVYVAQVGSTKYETIQAAVNAATAGQTVTIIANVSGEAVEANKNITITDNGEFTLNNVSINAVEGTSALTVSNLSFTGNSWINSGAASELVVSGVTADVTPSNASVTNSRSAFISLGRSEQKTLELTVQNSSIIARGGGDAILGWAAITEANITGNTFGSASAYQTNSDCVKFMAIANNAVLNITNNNVYSNYNGIVFGQNTTRDNAYTANVSGNNFYGGADHIWIEVSGSNTCHATINATSTNKVNGNAFTANDIKTHPNITTWTSYGGVDVVFDSNKKIIGGTFKYIADNVIAEGYEKSANTDGTYGIVKSISGKIAYRAYVNDTETREGVQVDLENVVAKRSVVVKLYDANGNALTTTTLKAGAAEAANLTCNIVLQGTASGSWETTINATLTVENIPAKIELLIDGTLKDTFENALGAGTNVDQTAKYIALDCVYKEAKINNTYYATLQAAIAAARDGQTITVLANVETTRVTLPENVTLDLNGKTVKADIIGTVKTNGGLWITSTGHKMLGLGADIYSTENATVVNNANEVNIVSGAITLATTEWWTLQNQNLTINSGATFTIPATSKLNVMNGTTVTVKGAAINNGTLVIYGTAIVNGTITATGTVELADVNATLKAQAGLNVITNIADHKVVYADDMYQVVAKVYVAQVGSTKYETLAEAIAAVPANQTITVLKDITLAETLTIAAEKSFTLDLNGKAINAGYQQNSTDKHIYAFDNKGSLTLANGTINARGIFNYGTLTVNATATINSIDANGGYGVDNYGTLNVYGTIATTNENNDAPVSGNYDATPINNRTNATVNVFEGSVIANVSNFTYALDNYGTAIIKGGSFSSGHTTVGNSGTMTIEGGSFVCNGSDGISSHALIAEAGTVTIKGGTFNGKDNNNGFNVYASEGAKVYISGGNFLSCHSGSLYGKGTIEVSGGKFFDAVPENRCAAGYIPTQFTDGTYGVKAGSYIAQIGTTKYETFEEAYEAAQAGDVIELFRTVVLTSDSDYNKAVTVKAEFNDVAFRVKASVSFNNMTINSDDYCVIVGASDGAGKLTINGGTYNGETTAVSVTKGEVNINGGTFKVEPYQGSYEYTINCIDANYKNGTAKVYIQGGNFYKFNPMNNAAEGAGTNFVVANHITVKDAENYWTVVALPTTNQIVSSADHKVTSEGYGPATVTVTGEVPCVANGQGIVSNWIGFRITKPQGIDVNVARVFTPGSNGTYNEKTLASILDEGQDYASMWVSIQYKRVFDYKIDWNNDGIMDLVINIDATTATIKHNYVQVERVEPSYGQDGYILYRCGCGHEYKETLPAELVAQIGETKYTTLEAAAAAAKANETIVVLADVETTNVALPTDVTLDLNGKTVEADIIGKISINKGLWVTKEGYKMIGDGAEYYQTTDATIVMGANYSIEMISGTVNLAKELWYTLQGQNITIKQGATFNISAGQTFVINGSTVENNGTVNNAGTIQILESATVKGNITGNLHFKGGNYITADNHKMVGTTSEYHYNATDALVNIATNGDITIAAGAMTLGHDWRTLPGQTVTVAEGATFTVPSGMTYQIYGTAIVNGTLTVNGTVELAVLEATLKAQSGLNVITNIEDHKVVYAEGMYKVVAKAYVAQIGTTKYETLEAAAAAAQTGQTITVLANVETTSVTLPENVTLDLNGKTVKADIIGKILINNGLWVTAEGYKMIGNGADYYQTTDATIVMGANYSIEMLSGTVSLVPNVWYTLDGQNITIKQDATFNINADQTFVINGSTVENNGTVNNAGTIQILAGTVKGNVTGNLQFKGGSYITAEDYNMVGTTSEYYYNTSNATINIEADGDITIASGDMTLGKSWRTLPGQTVTVAEGATFAVPTGMTYQIYGTAIVNGTLTVNGTVELTTLTATLKAQAGLNVITKIEDHKVVYAEGMYKVVAKAYVAQIGTTKYETLEAAAAAAQDGQTITVLANVETTNVTLPANVTLDLNGKTVKADIIGKINTNGGLWTTPQGYKMIGNGADYYQTTDATIVMGAKYSIEMLSGTVNLVPTQWYTLEGQNITIKQGATFNISAGQTFVINGSTVENNGTVNNAGTIQILAGTVKGNVTGNLQFNGGSYITAEDFNMVGKVGDSDYYYNTNNATINIAANGDITIASGDMTLGKSWRTLPGQTVTVAEGATFTVPSGMTYQIYGTAIVNGTLTVNGTVELAVLEATLKAQSGLNVITNIANHAVAYENGTYKVVQAIYEQNQTLDKEWNWFSSYINIDGEDGLEMIQDELATNAILIKNDNYYVEYSSNYNMWFGNLETVSVKEMYMIKTSAATQIQLSGELADPATAITLNKSSWSWIGYPIAHSMDLKAALSNLEATHGDQIKSNNGYALYYKGSGWYGTLNTLVPGQGYMYYSGNTEKDITLVYSTSGRSGELKDNVTAKDNYWTPRSSAFANNMTITAVLNADDVEMQGNYEVAAFANGEVRGSARPIYVDAIDRYVLFLTVHGEGNEELTFKYIDLDTNEEHSLSNVVTYSNDAILGSLSEPMVLVCGTMGIGENAANTLSIYPNPTTTNTAISFETAYDMVEVFNSLGVKVAEYRNVDSIDGIEAAGVYVIRVTNDSTVQNCRLIVK